jgi:hypothetical protein
VPTEQLPHEALEHENAKLRDSLKRCHAMLDDYRSKIAANANGDYRPPYESGDGENSIHRGEAS